MPAFATGIINALMGRSRDDGTKLVDASGKTLADIVAAVKRVTDIVSMIASSSSEQSAGIEQVNTAVSQIEQATQQNAALLEQTAATSQTIDPTPNTKTTLAMVTNNAVSPPVATVAQLIRATTQMVSKATPVKPPRI